MRVVRIERRRSGLRPRRRQRQVPGHVSRRKDLDLVDARLGAVLGAHDGESHEPRVCRGKSIDVPAEFDGRTLRLQVPGIGDGLRGVEVRIDAGQLVLDRSSILAALLDIGREDGSFGVIDPGEDRLQSIVIGLGDRVELVVVASGAMDRQPEEGRAGRGDHVVQVVHSLLLRPFRSLIADDVMRTSYEESSRRSRQPIALGQGIAGDLLGDETGERLVVVDGADHPIPIGPRVRPQGIRLVSVALSEADGVEPVPAPSFPVSRRGEQTINHALVGIGPRIVEEVADLIGRRREAGQVEGQTANQGGAIGLRRGGEVVGLQLFQDERIDRISRPYRRPRRFRTSDRLQRPPIRPGPFRRQRIAVVGRSRRDPGPQGVDLLGREFHPLRRHLSRDDLFDQRALIRLTGSDSLSVFSADEGRFSPRQVQAALLRRAVVAVHARIGEDRADLSAEEVAAVVGASGGREGQEDRDPRDAHGIRHGARTPHR